MKSLPLLLSCFISTPVIAHADEPVFNMSFVHGNHAAADVATFSQQNLPYPSGFYILDIFVNNTKVGHSTLTISHTAQHQLQLSPTWLKHAGIDINPSFYQAYFHKQGNYYILTDQPNTKITLNQMQQALYLSIPQVGLRHHHHQQTWDEGNNAFLVQYYLNTNKNQHQNTLFSGTANFSLNYHAWRLMGNINADNHDAEIPNIVLKRDIQAWQSDIKVGNTYTQTQYYSSLPFIGAALYSNSNMLPWSKQTYAPIISGVATDSAVITVTQDEYTLKQIHVAAGPYVINDLTPLNNGKITVTIRYTNGQVTRKSFGVNTLPSLLRPYNSTYYMATGIRNESNLNRSHKKLSFMIGEYSYGFSPFTLISGAIFANNYQNLLMGATTSFGELGAISLRTKSSFAHYNRHNTAAQQWNGHRLSLDYAKSFGQNTTLQMDAQKYTNAHYVSFSDFMPDFNSRQNSSEQYRYNVNLYQNINALNSSVQGGFWYAKGFNHSHSSGGNIYFNTNYKRAFINVNLSDEKDDSSLNNNLSVSLSVNLPFGAGNNTLYSNASMNYNNQSHRYSYTAGVSQSVSDRLNYSLNGAASGNMHSSSAYASYAFDRSLLSGSVSQGDNQTSMSAQLSGSIIGVHDSENNPILFTRDSGDTLAVVEIPKLPNITFNGSTPTNSDGFTVTELNSYQPNQLSIDPTNVPNSVDLLDSVYNITPTQGAIIYKKFNYTTTATYILQVMATNGFVVPFGSTVTTPDGQLVGYTQNHGILVVRVTGHVSQLLINTGEKILKINLNKVKPNINSVQEVKSV